MRQPSRRRLAAFALVAGVCTAGGAGTARAGITVTSFTTTADTNAYAPFSKAQYYQEQTLANVSPAVADVSANWTGANTGGTTPTWHWVGTSHATSSTNFGSYALTVDAAGSFSYELITTSGFVDPSSSTIYAPGGAADFSCLFTLDGPASYVATAELGRWGVLSLSSIESGFVFDLRNHSSTPTNVTRQGLLLPGHYYVNANASLSAPNLQSNVNDYIAAGSFSNFSLSVQVPEPVGLAAAFAAALVAIGRRRCCRRSGLELVWQVKPRDKRA